VGHFQVILGKGIHRKLVGKVARNSQIEGLPIIGRPWKDALAVEIGCAKPVGGVFTTSGQGDGIGDITTRLVIVLKIVLLRSIRMGFAIYANLVRRSVALCSP